MAGMIGTKISPNSLMAFINQYLGAVIGMI